MSFASFFTGLSGLQANQSTLQVVGNNLANLNTVGFKASRARFEDVFSGFAGFNGAGNPQQVGRGTQLSNIGGVFSQGSLGSSDLLTDMSIQGRGFFVLANEDSGLSYTRAGNFTFDRLGNLIASNGRIVQGFVQPDANGTIPTSGSLDNVRIPIGQTSSPQSTTEFSATFNLDSAKAEPFTTTIAIFDALGDRHDLTITFTPADNDLDANPATTDPDSWNYEVTVPGDEVAGGTAGVPFSVGTGFFAFDGSGELSLPTTDPVLNIPGWSNSAGAQTIDWQITDENGDGNLTSFADPSAISSSNQNGFGVGSLQTLIIGQDGLISGIFTNGANIELARIALATFNNEDGLLRDGANFFLATTSSGTATVGSASTGGRGLTVANSLELSNVDITTEFTQMIIGQRGYQANSRIITATDEIIQEALSLKR